MDYLKIGLQNVSSPSQTSNSSGESTQSINSGMKPPIDWSELTVIQTKFEVKYHPYKFIAYIRRELGLYRIMIGKEKECIRISIYDHEDDAYIHSFSYDEGCGQVMTDEEIKTLNRVKSLNSKNFTKYINQAKRSKSMNVTLNNTSQVESQIKLGLLPGVGSVALFKAACMLVFRLFPKVDKISFYDTSKIYSKIYKNIEVSLPSLYIIKYGQTWYQNKFNAVPANQAYNIKLNKQIKELLAEKLSENFDDFYSIYIEPYNILVNGEKISIFYDQTIKENFRKFYLNSETLTDFIENILKNYKDCLFIFKWLEDYVNQKIEWIPNRYSWLINREIATTWRQKAWNLEKIESKDSIDQNPFIGLN